MLKLKKLPCVLAAKNQLILALTATLITTVVAVGDAVGDITEFEKNGIQVKFSLQPLMDKAAKPQANSDVTFQFDIGDSSGSPISGAYPAVWMQRRAESVPTDKTTCQNMVKSFIGGSVLSQPTLNLNVYYVLVMNDDASISVVDPLFGFGGTNLLSMIPLSSPGYDWQLVERKQRLFVSLPQTQKLAVVDTASFKVLNEIDLTVTPGRVVLQPDQQYVWLGYHQSDAKGHEQSGVLVIDVVTGKQVAQIETGVGKHHISFSADSRYAFIANELGGGVSIVDVAQLKKIQTIATGGQPASIAYSSAADAIYVTHSDEGHIVSINAKTFKVNSPISVAPGLGQIRFAPGGRFAVVLNPINDMVYIWDAMNDRIVKSGKVEKGPDQVNFSDTLAHIRHRGSETVFMLSMDVITDPTVPMQVVDFPAGESAFGLATTPADGIVQAPGENAVLVAHPVDRQVYYYKEGMAAPMGSFKNFNRKARAVLAIDRTLQETEPGHYETVARLSEAGSYDVVFFMESPPVVHCFAARVLPNKEQQQQLPHSVIAQRLSGGSLSIGQSTRVRFRLLDGISGTPLRGVEKLQALIVLAPGSWQQRQAIQEMGDGVYAFNLTPTQEGAYFVKLNGDWDKQNLLAPRNLMFSVNSKN